MDFTFTTAQDDLAGLVRTLAGDLVTDAALRDLPLEGDRFDRRLWQALASADVVGAGLPEAAGGGGFGLLEQCSVLVELGRAVAPVPFRPTVVAASLVAEFGTPEQVEAWVGPAVRGELVLAPALTEAVPGDELSTRAEPDGDGFVVTGAKAVVPYGTVAGVVLVPAALPDGTAAVFAVLPSDAGVTVERQVVVDGGDAAWVELSGVRLGADRRIGSGDGVLPWLTRRATVALCAQQVGVVSGALDLTAAYATSREQFGRPIGAFQAVSQRVADAYIDVQSARLTMWHAAWAVAGDEPADEVTAAVATAKFHAAEAGHRVAHTGVHIHGGTGIDTDAPMHRYFVAAKRLEFELGGATAHLRELGAALSR
jgi:alkylation response protein AidB-like acyl-CoA dehydrogenase